MPRITGSNIATHVAEQEAAIFSCATRLFAEQGVNRVSMGTIADAVGLARPSLYRYFPTKAAIVLRWFNLVMTPLIETCNHIAEAEQAPSERFDQWIDTQIGFLADPAHQAMIRASLESSEMSDEQRLVIGARHRDLYASLDTILRDQTNAPDDETRRTRLLLIVGLLRNSPELTRGGIAASVAHTELLRAARLIGAG